MSELHYLFNDYTNFWGAYYPQFSKEELGLEEIKQLVQGHIVDGHACIWIFVGLTVKEEELVNWVMLSLTILVPHRDKVLISDSELNFYFWDRQFSFPI